MKIELAHGAGGEETSLLIHNIFTKYFHNAILNSLEDGAVLPAPQGKIVLTTDSFVVTPLEFPGGDIGRLSVCGTVNDLSAMGAQPLYLTAGFIIEAGFDVELLDRLANSMAQTAAEAGVLIVTGDTKVIEHKTADAPGLFINTAGVGVLPEGRHVHAANMQVGDALIISGYLGEHHGTIMAARMGLHSALKSDCAPLNAMVENLFASHIDVHTMRDITRGGLATVTCELAAASKVKIILEEEALPVPEPVTSLCGILGLDVLTMGNEGKMLIAVPAKEAEQALVAIRKSPYGANAAIIGTVAKGSGVELKTKIGGLRQIQPLRGEGLPRIC
jgi:hydrogenase expression/formation protein HypE